MTLLQELSDPRTALYPIKLGQYHRMIKQGIIEEGAPFELLNGAIVRKDRSAQGEKPKRVGLGHCYSVMQLQGVGEKLRRRGCHMRLQQPIAIPPINEPEPDGAIVRGTNDDYIGKLPEAKDILCAIEVSDASLTRSNHQA